MKWISTILSIYILALAILPCADQAIWCIFDVEKAIGVEFHETGDHNHENECSDHCTPLCTCSCCQITIRTPITVNLEIAPPIAVLSDPSSLESLLKDLTSLNDIWQPPKLG